MKSSDLLSVEQIRRGPTDPFVGIDWGADRLVLVLLGSKELWWRKPGTCWAGIGMPRSYVPGALMMYDRSDPHGRGQRLHQGGRLSRKLIVNYLKHIAKFFEFDDELTVLRIKPDRTLTSAADLKKYHEGRKR